MADKFVKHQVSPRQARALSRQASVKFSARMGTAAKVAAGSAGKIGKKSAEVAEKVTKPVVAGGAKAVGGVAKVKSAAEGGDMVDDVPKIGLGMASRPVAGGAKKVGKFVGRAAVKSSKARLQARFSRSSTSARQTSRRAGQPVARGARRVSRVAVQAVNAATRTVVKVVAVVISQITAAVSPLMLAVVAALVVIALVIAILPAWVVNFINRGGEAQLVGVPSEYESILTAAGSICPAVKPYLLAGQIEAESGWNNDVVSSAGAQGIAQFMPGTWAQHGFKANTDEPGDITNAQDQIWSMGKYMCHLYGEVEGISSKDRPYELALAAYNAGIGRVISAQGVPAIEETQQYVKRVLEYAQKYMGGGTGPINASQKAILDAARRYFGAPYVWGGESAAGMDCSGLVTLVFRQFGLEIPHHANTAATNNQGTLIPPGAIQPGDVLYFSDASGYYDHVAIYSGVKNGVRMQMEAMTYGVPMGEYPVPARTFIAKRYF